jgi:hypothetical protein
LEYSKWITQCSYAILEFNREINSRGTVDHLSGQTRKNGKGLFFSEINIKTRKFAQGLENLIRLESEYTKFLRVLNLLGSFENTRRKILSIGTWAQYLGCKYIH